jgi:hypothetical protein
MGIRFFIIALFLISSLTLSVACASNEDVTRPTSMTTATTPTSTTTNITNNTTKTTTMATSQTSTTTVTQVELPDGVTWITAEELYEMMLADPDWRDYIKPVDARETMDWEDGRVPSADNVPNIRDTALAIRGRQNGLKVLPMESLLVFYGYNQDGSDAADLVQQMVDLNTDHDINNMRVLKFGFDRWLELLYPTSSASG